MVFKTLFNVLSVLALAALCDASNEVKVKTYSYDGSTLTGTIAVQNIAYAKVVKVIYANTAQTWGNTCNAGYTSGPDSSGSEVWTFNCAISSAGISQFYVEYDVNNSVYYDNNGGYGVNYQVTTTTTAPVTTTPATTTPATTSPATTTPGSTTAPVTTATPTPTRGFQSDITTYLASAIPAAKTYMLANISPTNVSGALAGSIIAASPGGANNYVYHWIRDSGLVMDVVNSLYVNGNTSLASTFWDHATFNKQLQGLTTTSGLGEPKFYVNGTAFNDAWCRPQNDGPALRASSFMRFSKQYLANGGTLQRVVDLWNSSSTGLIKNDINYVISNKDETTGCDLWEEQHGSHFFTVAMQRRALHEAASFATFLGDTSSASTYASAASAFDTKIANFWNSGSQDVQTTLSGRLLDSAIPLGAVHGDVGDGVFAPQDDRILKTVFDLETGFISEYTISSTLVDASGLPLSVAIGRYYGDVYDGSSTSSGNPWYLCTLIVGEVAYRAATAYVKAGSLTVTTLNSKFFNGASPAGLGLSVSTGTYASDSTTFTTIVEALKAYGDKHVRRVKYHGASGYHLNEQYNRNTGYAQGVNDLTWSYAALITANLAREELKALSA